MKPPASSLHNLRNVLKNLAYAPLSPPLFRAFVGVLRALHVLRKPAAHAGRSVKSIFIPHPYSKLGDLVLLLPLIEEIRRQFPMAAIDVAVGKGLQDLLAGVEGLRHVFPCDSPRFQRRLTGRYQRILADLLLYRRSIMQFDYDLAVVPQWGELYMLQPAYLAFLTGAPLRCGYSATVDGGNPAFDTLLTHTARGGAHEQTALRNLLLLTRTGLASDPARYSAVPARPISSLVNLAGRATDEEVAAWLRRTTGRSPAAYGIVAPAAAESFRAYPVELFAEVIRRLNDSSPLFFFITGGKGDSSICDRLVELVPDFAASLAGKTDLKMLTAVIARARLFLGNDSGAAHIAGGLGVPTVVISSFAASCRDEHPNSPERSRPCGPGVFVLQPDHPLPPCRGNCDSEKPHCITQIPAQEVLDTVRSLALAQQRPYA